MSAIRRSLLLSLTDSYLGIVLQLASTVIIARLLTPEQTGVFAVAAVFAALASTFRDFGVAEYLIQERELTPDRIRAALALNIMASWSMAVLLVVLSAFAGDFYRNPGVTDVMRVQALCFLLVPFGAVTQAWFRRELNYRPILICNLLSSIASFVVAVTLAFAGFGYMSLAWSALAGIAVTVAAATWFRPPEFPRWPGLAEIGRVFAFGKFAGAVYVVGQVGKGAPELVIGRALTMADVGMFSRANGLVEIFHRLVLRPVLQVCMPYFAKSDREHGTLTPAYVRSVSVLTAVGWPFLAWIAVCAYAAIRLVYGSQWLAAVPVAQLLCLACSLELLFLLSREALLACGEGRRAHALQMGLVALQIVGLGGVLHSGLIGAAWGLVAASGLGIGLAHWHLRRGIGLNLRDLLRPCLPSLALTAFSVGPIAAAAAIHPIGENNFQFFGLTAAFASLALWLLGLRLLRHVLWGELELVGRRLADHLPFRRRESN